MTNKIKVLIVDDHPIFRRGLVAVIESIKNLKLVGEAENGEESLRLVETLDPNIVILDIDMPILDGIETAKILNIKFPKIKTVFLSMHKEIEFLQSLKRLDVRGYVLKQNAVIELEKCIKAVVSGEIYVSKEIKNLTLQSSEDFSANKSKSLISTLTPTELRILRHLAKSKTSKEIAEELFVSVRTVENHRFKICSKLNLRGIHSLLEFALTNRDRILENFEDESSH